MEVEGEGKRGRGGRGGDQGGKDVLGLTDGVEIADGGDACESEECAGV